ncbi:hypothetical protein, partial [Curtobacterium oceanosedimentum]|uniref:hypothetical protein n=1 Tax=Curtobacterium oceanosedimentum TaxID=465820 RepID=UPI000B2F4017
MPGGTGRTWPERAYLVEPFDQVRPFSLSIAVVMGRNGRAELAVSVGRVGTMSGAATVQTTNAQLQKKGNSYM